MQISFCLKGHINDNIVNLDEQRPDEAKLLSNNPTSINPSGGVASGTSAHLSSHSSSQSQSNSAILLQLSPEHLILIRTILLIKFFAAKNKFKLAFKPYDFKDVIEQYKQGNADILVKIKDLHRRLEQMNNFAMSSASSSYVNPGHVAYLNRGNSGQAMGGTQSPRMMMPHRSISPLFMGSQPNSQSQMRNMIVGSPPSPSPLSPPSPIIGGLSPRLSSNRNSSARLNRVMSSQVNVPTYYEYAVPVSSSSNFALLTPDQLDIQQQQQQLVLNQLKELNSNTQVTDRINRIENNMDSLGSKLDKLLQLIDKS
jgi:hypothetical protein